MKTILITESVFLFDAAFQKRPNPVPTSPTRRIVYASFRTDAPTATNDNAKCMLSSRTTKKEPRMRLSFLGFAIMHRHPLLEFSARGSWAESAESGVWAVSEVWAALRRGLSL